MKIGQVEIDLEELQNFIVKAKKNGYAGGGEYLKLKDGSKIFTFQEKDLHYEDRFWGSIQAPGREVVRFKDENGQGIWFMAYSGGMLPKHWGDEKLSSLTFKFLKNALRQIDSDAPFRGPGKYENVNFIYETWAEGDIQRFSGKEEIISKKLEKIIFSQDLIGGLVIP